MSLQVRNAAVVSAALSLVLTCHGCASRPGAMRQATWDNRAANSADSDISPDDSVAKIGTQPQGRLGSSIAPPTDAVSSTPTNPASGISGGGANATAMAEVLHQLQAMGTIDPAAQARLFEDLQKTDPALWPQLIKTFQATLAYHQRLAAKDATKYPTAAQAPAAALSTSAAQTPTTGQLSAVAGQPSQMASAAPAAAPAPSPATPLGPQAMQSVTPEQVASVTYPPDRSPHPVIAPALAAPQVQTAVETQSIAAARPDSVAPSSTPPATLPADAGQVPHVLPTGAADPATPPSTALVAKPEAGPAAASSVAQASFSQPLADGDWQGRLHGALLALEAETRAARDPAADLDRQAYLRLLYLISGRREDALRPIPGLSPAEQDFWTKELYGLGVYFDSARLPDARGRAAEAALHLSDATARLRESGVLVVRNLAFCTEVNSYGVYKQFDKYEFKPGQEVLLYAEVENFLSEAMPDGFHTSLDSSYQILDGQGNRVEEKQFGTTQEVCRNRRRDFFIRYQFPMPSRVYDGPHTLKLSIEDALGKKLGESSVEFTIKSK